MDIVVGTRIDPDGSVTLPAAERLARSIATMQAIEQIVMTFPVMTAAALEENLNLIHALLQAALAEYTAV